MVDISSNWQPTPTLSDFSNIMNAVQKYFTLYTIYYIIWNYGTKRHHCMFCQHHCGVAHNEDL